jgi:hypothetical protein
MRPTSRLALACLVSPVGVPLVVVPLALLEAWQSELTATEAMVQAAVWSAFGMPAALMSLVVFWAPLHLWLQSYAIRDVLSYLAAASGVMAVLSYLAAMALPGSLGGLTRWQWVAFVLSGTVVGLLAWALATAAGRR